MDRYDTGAAACMDELLVKLLTASLEAAGWIERTGPLAQVHRRQIPDREPFWERWLTESCAAIESCVHTPEERADLGELWQQWDHESKRWMLAGEHAARITLAEVCLRALPDILSGRKRATDVMFPDSSTELVGRVYRDNHVADYFNDVLADSLVTLVEARRRLDPGAALKVLEAGAGTGATSAAVLARLEAASQGLTEYCFSDVSHSFLRAAAARWETRGGFLTTRRFDVEVSPGEQGLSPGEYDFVIAANVLHAMTNIRISLRHLKTLLKRNGVLLINELSTKTLLNHVTFGLLEGWWRYEDEALRIPGSPLLEPRTWERVLREEGFREIIQPALAKHPLGQQILVAESDGFVRSSSRRSATQVCTSSADMTSELASGSVPDGRITDLLREAVAEALGIPEGEVRDHSSFVDYGVDSLIAVRLINRINRSLGLALRTTVLFDYSSIANLARHIAEHHIRELTPAGLHIPALAVSADPRTLNAPPRVIAEGVSAAVAQEGHYHRALLRGPGDPGDIEISQTPAPRLAPTEVSVSTRAFALNFADLLCIQGLYPTLPDYPFTPGMDAAGVVVAVGTAVTSVAVGDEVITGIGSSLGAHATLLVVDERCLFRMPKGLSFTQACVLNTATIAVVGAFRKAAVRAGESVLIQSAAGGVGLTAVQLARHHGARIYATAGSQHKLDYLARAGVDHPINYLETDFESELRRLTGGTGVDVVINTLPGPAIQKGMNCLAPGGRYVELAVVALESARGIDLSALASNKSLYTLNIRVLHREDPEVWAAYRDEMLRLHDSGVLSPPIGRVFEFPQLVEAYRHLASRQSIGRVVVNVPVGWQFAAQAQAPREALPTTPAAVRTQQAIAIIGRSGRFARSESLEEFWEHLAAGHSLIEKASRWELSTPDGSASPDLCCDQGSFLEGIDRFDPRFFEISGAEAACMDPQQRLFLEECWKALENAGHAGSGSSESRCGVYVGCATSHYSSLLGPDHPAQGFWGNAQSVVPARIAYYLNLLGPAIAVDTACSSSLVAVHLSCQALWQGEIDMALAGGVFVQCTTAFFDSCNRARMLSTGGRCYTFDARADGFVPGEGVGVVVLKRLHDAIEAGDHIYAVIRGSGMNQDGTTNGITAPSALAQERLERAVYDRFGIDPATLSLVEAHGTGTRLGDPIEFSALTRAFATHTERRGFCALGSVKTNIGHAATAAGVAGLLKVLLALEHRQIPPSLNFDKVNPAIDLEDSPFRICTELTQWTPAAEVRRAAISSFGFSGTNAHLVVEEAPRLERVHPQRPGYLIALSARTSGQLRSVVQRLLDYCAQAEGTTDLGNMSYTLLTGRKHCGHRLACAVSSIDELRRLLSRWLEGKSVSQISTGAHDGPIREQPSLKRYGAECVRECSRGASGTRYLENLAAIADLYAQGYSFDIEELFGRGYQRIPLPTYPFAREIYWPAAGARPTLTQSPLTTSQQPAMPLHPLLHRNTSTLSQQRFNTLLSGADTIVKDHIVLGEPVLPAVAYLEMALAAIRESVPAGPPHGPVRLRNVVWVRPLKVIETTDIQLGLSVVAPDRFDFEIRQAQCDESLHAQGTAERLAPDNRPSLDLEILRARMSSERIDPQVCYEAFSRIGIHHGPLYRSLTGLYTGADEVLAELRLPESLTSTAERYCLHPSLLDGALQAAIGLSFGSPDSDRPALPFALRELEVYAPSGTRLWSWVRRAESAPDGTRAVDVDLCNADGRICARIRGLTSRVYGGEPAIRAQAAQADVVLTTPVWTPRPSAGHSAQASFLQRRILLCDSQLDPRRIEAAVPGSLCASFSGGHGDWARGFETYAGRVFELIGELLQPRQASSSGSLLQIAVTASPTAQLAGGLSGLLKTATLEHAGLRGQVLILEPGETPESLGALLRENAAGPVDTLVRYVKGERQVQVWEPLDVDTLAGRTPWRANGAYVITGGLGGLGRLFAAEILAEAPEACVILTGRSPLGERADREFAALQKLGNVSYRQVDATDPAAVEHLVQEILREHRVLHGLIHSAGVIRDQYVSRKTRAQFAEVLAPKISGALNLDQATHELDLDFFVLCSSGTGTFGNPGQADYAAANAWLDSFASHRNALVSSGERKGHTLSMIWPLWADGGMTTDPQTREMLQRRLGMMPMSSAVGMQALRCGLSRGGSQLLVMQGLREKMMRALRAAHTTDIPVSNTVRQSAGTSEYSVSLASVQEELAAIAAATLRLSKEDIGPREELSRYGFDSILLTDFANRLNQRYALELAPTIFFEHTTLEALARHLLESGSPRFGAEPRPSHSAERAPARQASAAPPLPAGRFMKVAPDRIPAPQGALAIVGMSGAFPMADDIDTFWRNLEAGRDCITEIPRERWTWSAYCSESDLSAANTPLRWGGLLTDMAGFDPLFFRISPREAEFMDPQQRLMLMHAYRAIEDAGYSPKSLAGQRIGVFIGTGNTGYATLVESSAAATDSLTATGLIPSLGPNRISYFLNLHGPSEPIETACSSSLVAVHRAIQEIGAGRCEAALVGGVNTLVTPETYLRYSKAGMLSPDGRCKAFGAGANGYGRGEGVGILFVKPLEAAQRTGDVIHAVIRGSAVNHGGRANSLTAPNPKAQADLLKEAYTRSGINPASIGYIEAHGTGTELGDPVELNGLLAAFRELAPRDESGRPYCGLGSVKSNIGHLELAAGIAGLIKTVLQLEHRTLVRSLHCESPNPYLDFAASPFFLVRQNQPWTALTGADGETLPRRAGVSSFGFGGTNAHVILEESPLGTLPLPRLQYPREDSAAASIAEQVIVPLSARTHEQLRQVTYNLLAFLERSAAVSLQSLAFTLQVGRDALEGRIGFIVSSIDELRAKLEVALAAWGTEALREVAGVRTGEVREAVERNTLFNSEADLREVIHKWLRAGKHDQVLGLWTGGVEIDWVACYEGTPPQRMSLPTYPFSCQKFWLQTASSPPVQPRLERPNAPTLSAEATLHMCTPMWNPIVLRPNSECRHELSEHVLIVGGTSEQQRSIQRVYPNSTVLQLERRDELESVRDRMTGGSDWAHIVWIGGQYPTEVSDTAPTARMLEAQADGVMQVFSLAKALVALGYGTRRLSWTLVTFNSQAILHEEALNPTDSAVHGFAGSLAQEFPQWTVRLADVAAHEDWSDDVWRLPRDTGGTCARRGGVWYRQTLAPVEDLRSVRSPYRDDGVYVVIGGAGGLGALWTRHVIERHGARVYWIGRRAQDAVIEEQIAQLSRMGPPPVYLQADAADPVQLEGVYRRIKQAHSRIHGVIHAAVGEFDRSIEEYDAAHFRLILGAKVAVAVAISQVFEREPCDFVVFFSSMAAFARSGGMSAYSAGCAFKDAFARWLGRRRPGCAKVVNWGYWELGSGTRISRAMKIRLQQEGIRAIDPAQGMAALERLLRSPLDQLAIWSAVGDAVRAEEGITMYPDEIPSTLQQLGRDLA